MARMGWCWLAAVIVATGCVGSASRSTTAASDLEVDEPENHRAPIDEFWAWWRSARRRYELPPSRPLPPALAASLEAHVEAMGPGLRWELGGSPGRRTLVVTAGRDFGGRRRTEAWVAAAPSDPGWRYLPAREARAGATTAHLKLSGTDLAIAELRFVCEPDSARTAVHLKAFHPSLTSLTEDDRNEFVLQALEALLGEDAVDRWIGRVEIVPTPPEPAIDPATLQLRVSDLATAAARITDRKVTHLATTEDNRPVVAMIALGLKRLDHVDHAWHVEVVIPYQAPTAAGMPTEAEHQAGHLLEESLRDSAGDDSLWYGHVVEGGELRILFYARRRAPVERAIAAWARAQNRRDVVQQWSRDPDWERFGKF